MKNTPMNHRHMLVTALLLVCSMMGFATRSLAQSAPPRQLPGYVIDQFGAPPPVPSGDYSPTLARAVQFVIYDTMSGGGWGIDQTAGLATMVDQGDPRVVWLLSDLLRFIADPVLTEQVARAASDLLGIEPDFRNPWGRITDHLIAWDIPAPPNYLAAKRAIFTTLVPGWERLFINGDIDWRLVSWGGVLIDNRPYNTTDDPCNCIPAADNPQVTSGADAHWLDEDSIVFGIEINGEARAYPRQIMEVREMVNDTLGGRDLGIPYCTLCGAAQAYFTDALPQGVERPILRTSGLLSRSNKVMYDIQTYSIFDTFLGHAVTGPLAELEIQLPQAPVVTTTWGKWKQAHPNTTVLAEYLALGRNFDFRNNRDANGPIFPVGDVDPRLPVHEEIIGVVTAFGTPIAFQRNQAFLVLNQGDSIDFENVRLVLDAGGIKAVDTSGADWGSHQAFWFAWSQFHPTTQLWQGPAPH